MPVAVGNGSEKNNEIRKPQFAGRFYPDDPAGLKSMIQGFVTKAEKTEIRLPETKALKALIMPHAGYIYSGLTAAHACLALESRTAKAAHDIKKVIVMGPDHRTGMDHCAVSCVAAYQTPLGQIPLHRDAEFLAGQSDIFQKALGCDKTEHSIEVVLPFLQFSLDHFELIPIVMGQISRKDLKVCAGSIEKLIDKDTLVVASSDLSHYFPWAEAVKRDRQTIEMILKLDSEQVASSYNRLCGCLPVAVLLDIAQRNQWQPVLLHYSNSGDTAGDKKSVVGYTAIAFYGELFMTHSDSLTKKTSPEKGRALILLARKKIAEKLGLEFSIPEEMNSILEEDMFKAKRGTFVTLTINTRLRGCIGSLSADESIVQGVKHNAVNASFHDPRFPPLSKNEFKKMDIEISLLTEPEPLGFSDSKDLLEKLRPEIDGVILRKGRRSATFLPQVWEQLPDKKRFLAHLCTKAGLDANAWQLPDIEILTYQVQYFKEE